MMGAKVMIDVEQRLLDFDFDPSYLRMTKGDESFFDVVKMEKGFEEKGITLTT